MVEEMENITTTSDVEIIRHVSGSWDPHHTLSSDLLSVPPASPPPLPSEGEHRIRLRLVGGQLLRVDDRNLPPGARPFRLH